MKHFFLLTLLFTSAFAFSQIGIGTTTPSTNAELDISSSTKGVLLPRLTNNQVLALAGNNPASGMLVFNTTRNCIQVFTGTIFECITVESNTDTTKDGFANDEVNNTVKLVSSSVASFRAEGTDFVITDDGWVGIGTDAPTKELDVVGEVKIGIIEEETPPLTSTDRGRVLFAKNDGVVVKTNMVNVLRSSGTLVKQTRLNFWENVLVSSVARITFVGRTAYANSFFTMKFFYRPGHGFTIIDSYPTSGLTVTQNDNNSLSITRGSLSFIMTFSPSATYGAPYYDVQSSGNGIFWTSGTFSSIPISY